MATTSASKEPPAVERDNTSLRRVESVWAGWLELANLESTGLESPILAVPRLESSIEPEIE
jgi:hypothetical protein